MTTTVTEVRFAFDPERTRRFGRSPEMLLLARRCYRCASRYEDLGEVPPVEEQLKEIAECCGQQDDFIAPEMPMMEIAFRTLLAAGNRPMTLQELYDELTDRWATPANPRNMSPEALLRILNSDTYYGIVQVPAA